MDMFQARMRIGSMFGHPKSVIIMDHPGPWFCPVHAQNLHAKKRNIVQQLIITLPEDTFKVENTSWNRRSPPVDHDVPSFECIYCYHVHSFAIYEILGLSKKHGSITSLQKKGSDGSIMFNIKMASFMEMFLPATTSPMGWGKCQTWVSKFKMPRNA